MIDHAVKMALPNKLQGEGGGGHLEHIPNFRAILETNDLHQKNGLSPGKNSNSVQEFNFDVIVEN